MSEEIDRKRIMTYDGIRGWLVDLARLSTDPPCLSFFRLRFEPDQGDGVALFVVGWTAGGPGDLRRRLRRKNKAELPHEKHWTTAELIGGETFVYCLEKYADDVCWPKGICPPALRLPLITSKDGAQ